MKQTNLQHRRRAIKCIGIAGIAIPLSTKLTAVEQAEPAQSKASTKASGYQLTEHIKQYYLSLIDQ
ncbi:hypothetical protein [Thalassotalea maritima]|uniref:hypothetical protein n=1 Tax=Thalassotalea maritima TaxID=3242416 RepID=UPI003528E71C